MPTTDPVATQAEPPPSEVAHAKQILRAAVIEARSIASAVDRAGEDELRTVRVQEFVGELARPGLTVAAHVSFGTEPSTLQLIAWLHGIGATVLLPHLTADDPHHVGWAHYAGADALQEGRRGILQPVGPPLPPSALAAANLIICPGLAASPAGDRLGRGGGWYDRALPDASETSPRVCLLNDNEIIDQVPREETDAPVDVIITPTRTVICGALDTTA